MSILIVKYTFHRSYQHLVFLNVRIDHNARNCGNKIFLFTVRRNVPNVVCSRFADVGNFSVSLIRIIGIKNITADKLLDRIYD